jgi:tetratricopeptide (TPR) repeat protein
LRDLGDLAGGKRHAEYAVALSPRDATYYYTLADLVNFTNAPLALAALEELLRDEDSLPPPQRTHLHFALGKAYADLGEVDRSFRHLLMANRIHRGRTPYNEAHSLAQLDRIKAAFPLEGFLPVRPDKGAGEEAIFIVGMPRSGSTLLEQILASHPKVAGIGELDLLDHAITAALGQGAYPEIVPRLGSAELERLASHYLEGIKHRAPTARRVTDKNLLNFRHCGLIHLALPRARILHIRRDPVDACLSGFSKLFTGTQYYNYDLAELGRYYRAYDRLMAHWEKVLPREALLTVQYEELVLRQEEETRRVLDFCGLEWDDACLSFERTRRTVRTASAAQVRQPIYRSAIARQRPSPNLIKPLTDQLGDLAKPR